MKRKLDLRLIVSGEDALKAIQGDFEKVGNVIKAEFTPPPSPEEIARHNMETTLRSLLNEMLPSLVALIQAKLDSLEGESRTRSLAIPVKEEKSVQTVQRSLPPTVVRRKMIENTAKIDSFQAIANRTVGVQ